MPHSVDVPGRLSLACVDPALVPTIWPIVAPLIRSAMQRGDTGSYHPVEHNVRSGRALLWVVTDGREIRAAVVTELHQTEWRKVCVIVACAGDDRRRWLHLIEQIEAFAKSESCAAVRIVGRQGWARVLPQYRTKRLILEKELG